MKAVIYARYSSENQREESIEGQIRECTAFAEKNGITILKHYIDRAYSAKTDNRPEFQRMIKDSAKKGFDVVIVWKLDRFSRNRYDSAKYKAMLRKNDVKVVSATESISEGAEGIILESVLEGMAEYYSADLAEKVSRGMTENALKCRFNGGNIPFGYMIDEEQHYQPDPEKAPLVIEMFRRYAGGESITDIVEDLNARGIRTSKGNRFNKNSLARIFANRRYIGEYAYKEIVFSNDSSIPYAHYHDNSMPVGVSSGNDVLVFLMGEFHKLLLHYTSDGFYLISDDSRFFKFKIGGCLFHLSFKVLYYLCIFSLEEKVDFFHV